VRTDNSYAYQVGISIGRIEPMVAVPAHTYLLHDARFPLGECDVTARLVRDELDLDLASLTTSLLIVVIVVVGCHGVSWSLDTSRIIAVEIIARGWIVEAGRWICNVGHYDLNW
jgi:hypothetical protein